MSDQPISVVHFGVGDDRAEAVAAVLRERGLATQVIRAQESRGDAGSLALIVLLAIGVHGFLSALGESLGAATGRALQTLFERMLARLHDGRTERPGIILRDAVHGIDVEISTGLPAEAFDQLRTLTTEGPVRLRYEPVTGAWMVVDG